MGLGPRLEIQSKYLTKPDVMYLLQSIASLGGGCYQRFVHELPADPMCVFEVKHGALGGICRCRGASFSCRCAAWYVFDYNQRTAMIVGLFNHMYQT